MIFYIKFIRNLKEGFNYSSINKCKEDINKTIWGFIEKLFDFAPLPFSIGKRFKNRVVCHSLTDYF